MQFYKYFYDIKDPFQKVTDLGFKTAEEYITHFRSQYYPFKKTYDLEYFQKRLYTEDCLRKNFIMCGGKPVLEHPHYFILNRADDWFYQIKNSIGSLMFDSELFRDDAVSFTYGDSIPTFAPEYNDGKAYRQRVYTKIEIGDIISEFGYPQEWNTYEEYGPENYIEVQVWDDEFIRRLRPVFASQSTNDLLTSCDLLGDAFLSANRLIQGCLPKDSVQLSLPDSLSLMSHSPNVDILRWFLSDIKQGYMPDEPIHGIGHGVRCALYAFLLGVRAELNREDLYCLTGAALYHDIGRKVNNDHKRHGKESAKLIPIVLPEATGKQLKLIQAIVTLHSLDDNTQDMVALTNSERKISCLLKDTDSLDYIRFGIRSYDPRYFRCVESYNFIKFAAEINYITYCYPDKMDELLNKFLSK